MGPGRAGKTSLCKALLGQEFDPDEASTEVYDVEVIDTGDWKAQQTVGLDWRRLAAARVNRAMEPRETDKTEEGPEGGEEVDDQDTDDKGRDRAIYGAAGGGATASTAGLLAPPFAAPVAGTCSKMLARCKVSRMLRIIGGLFIQTA